MTLRTVSTGVGMALLGCGCTAALVAPIIDPPILAMYVLAIGCLTVGMFLIILGE